MLDRTEVIIIGAGPAGLAAGACLRREGVPFVIVERAAQAGSSWRRHYERLHLHTVKQFSSLPGMAWPDRVPMYPARADVVEYLEAYARRYHLLPRFGQEVTSARHDGSGWIVRSGDGELRGRGLVVATGYNRVPRVPALPGRERFRGGVMHSSEYANGAALRGKRALVVGLGNSGGEIALDLWESGAETSLSVRSPVHVVPRDALGIPAQLNSIFLFGRLPPRVADRIALAMMDRLVGDLSRWGIRRPAIGPASQVVEQGRIPLIDIGTVALIKQGKIKVFPGPRELTETGVVFTDGRELPLDAVVLATGYRAALEGFLENAASYVDDRGYPRWHGREASTPGLYFIGFRNPLTGALHDIAAEAQRIGQALAKR